MYPENLQAFELFLFCPWRSDGAIGIDYPSLHSILQMENIEDVKTVWRKIRYIEQGAATVLREKREHG